jgi:S-DNA-T family DNA segregation ATPase FtsK/SpoIIIE
MPLVNVIRGEQVPDALLNVRHRFIRLPLWLVVTCWCLKQLALAVFLAARYWYLTGPVLLTGWLWWRFGWPGPATLAAGAVVTATGWWLVAPGSFGRWCRYPLLARRRRWSYGRRWWAAMATTGLVVRFEHHEVVPILKRVRCRPGADELGVRMVTGQIPDDYARAAERFAHTFGARAVRVRPHPRRPDLVTLTRGCRCSTGWPARTPRPWPTCSTRPSPPPANAPPGCAGSPASTSPRSPTRCWSS